MDFDRWEIGAVGVESNVGIGWEGEKEDWEPIAFDHLGWEDLGEDFDKSEPDKLERGSFQDGYIAQEMDHRCRVVVGL